MEINLKKYGPIISTKEIGQELLELIQEKLIRNTVVEIDLSSIKTMATFCAKQVFGTLYINLTPSVFYERIKLKNANEDLKMIIRLGILNAIQNE